MAAYLVKNICGENITLEIRAPIGVRRFGRSFTIAPNEVLDILPYAGSIEQCKQIAYVTNLLRQNLVEVTCQP